MNQLKKVLSEKWLELYEKQIILVVFLIGFMVRFWGFPGNIGWDGDIGRDFLVGYSIVENGERPLIGHWNSGLGSVYPPIYYYIIGFSTFLFEDFRLIAGFFLFLHSFSVVIFYKAVENYFSKRIGFIACVLYALSYRAIFTAMFPNTAHFSLIIFICSLWFLSLFLTTKKNLFLLLTSFSLTLTTSIFYGGMIFFFIYGFLISLHFFENKKAALKKVMLFFIFSFTLLMPIFGWKNWTDISALSTDHLSIFLKNLPNLLYLLSREFRNFFIIPVVYLPTILWAVTVVLKRKKSIVVFSVMVAIFLVITCSLLLFNDPLFHYSLFITPFVYIGIAIIFNDLFELEKSKLSILFLAITFVSAGSFAPRFFISEYVTYHKYFQLDAYVRKHFPNYTPYIFCGDLCNDWENKSLKYFQRDKLSSEADSSSKKILNICYYRDFVSGVCQKKYLNNNYIFLKSVAIGEEKYWLFTDNFENGKN